MDHLYLFITIGIVPIMMSFGQWANFDGSSQDKDLNIDLWNINVGS